MQDTLSFGSFQISRRRRLLRDSGTPVKLSQRAFDLPVALAEGAGEVISGDEFVVIAWPNVTVAQVAPRRSVRSLAARLA